MLFPNFKPIIALGMLPVLPLALSRAALKKPSRTPIQVQARRYGVADRPRRDLQYDSI